MSGYGTNGTELRDKSVPTQATRSGTLPCKGSPVPLMVPWQCPRIESSKSCPGRVEKLKMLLAIPGIQTAAEMASQGEEGVA